MFIFLDKTDQMLKEVAQLEIIVEQPERALNATASVGYYNLLGCVFLFFAAYSLQYFL